MRSNDGGRVMRIDGVILAGGTGTRMGGADKALLLLGGLTLAQRAADRLRPQVASLAISANGDPARFAFLGLPVLPDAVPQGPLSGLLSGLAWAAAEGADALVSVAVDTPFFPDDLVLQLEEAGRTVASGAAVAIRDGRLHPTFGLWPVALEPVLRDRLAQGRAKLTGFAAEIGAAQAVFPAGGTDPFRNLNTPADLAEAEVWLRP